MQLLQLPKTLSYNQAKRIIRYNTLLCSITAQIH